MSKKSAFIGKFVAVMSVLCFMLSICAAMAPADDQEDRDELLFRLDVENAGKESIHVSIPYSVFYKILDVLPKETHERFAELGIKPHALLDQIASMEGMDIVRIEGRENVSVRVEECDEETRKDLNLIKIEVHELRDEGERIRINLPVGLVHIASEIVGNVIRETGIHKELEAQLPKILEQIKKDIRKSHERR